MQCRNFSMMRKDCLDGMMEGGVRLNFCVICALHCRMSIVRMNRMSCLIRGRYCLMNSCERLRKVICSVSCIVSWASKSPRARISSSGWKRLMSLSFLVLVLG